jgi:sugar lactone lactonase YvrE
LGLKFNEKTGDLYIADAYHGLMVVHPGENVARVVATEADGVPFRFTNSIEIDGETGIVYFTDTSTQYHRRYGDFTFQLFN